MNDDNHEHTERVPKVGADHSGMNISDYMDGEGIEGGVGLDDDTPVSGLADKGRKYDVGDMVAKGGMGAILAAKDLNIRRQVAMKVMLDPKDAGQDKVVRFIECGTYRWRAELSKQSGRRYLPTAMRRDMMCVCGVVRSGRPALVRT